MKPLMRNIAWIMLAFAVLKVLIVTFASPLIAYANNWDFIRVESCIGLYQQYDDGKTAAHKQGPVNNLVLDGDKNPDLCLKSLDVGFPFVATLFHSVGDHIDFREIGVIKTAFLFACLALAVFLVRSRRERVALAVSFLLVFGDISYLSHINTLYTEFSVMMGIFFSILLLSIFWNGVRPPRKIALAFTFGAILLLGLSKQEYSALATILGLSAALVAWRRWDRKLLAAAFAVPALLLPFTFGAIQGDTAIFHAIQFANKTDTYLYGVLPYTSNHAAALDTLGLPQSCEAGIGLNWFTPGLQVNHPCPEVLTASRARLLLLWLKDPVSFLKPVYRGINESRPIYVSDLGNVEDESVHDSLAYRLVKYTSITILLDALPGRLYALAIYASIAAGLLGAALILVVIVWKPGGRHKKRRGRFGKLRPPRWKPGGEIHPGAAMLALGGFTVLYSVASAVFGDGFAEVPKHAIGLGIGFGFQLTGLVLMLLNSRLTPDGNGAGTPVSDRDESSPHGGEPLHLQRSVDKDDLPVAELAAKTGRTPAAIRGRPR